MHSRTTMEMSICQAENGFPAFSFGFYFTLKTVYWELPLISVNS